MRKQWYKILAGVLVCLQIFITMSFLAMAAEDTVSSNTKTEIHYVALGDSITEGNNTYVNEVSNYLKQTYASCTVTNFGVSGWRSYELLDALDNSSNPYHAKMCAALKKADVVTIDIGSNDIMFAAYEVLAESLGCTIYELPSVLTSWYNKLTSPNRFVAMKAYLQLIPLVYTTKYKLYNGQTMKDMVTAYKKNYVSILAKVSQLAPGAKIYVGNIYNPYKEAPTVSINGVNILDVNDLAERYVSQLNAVIANNSSGCKVVDLYHTITKNSQIQATYEYYDYNPHPNAAGQKAIANKFIAAMQ